MMLNNIVLLTGLYMNFILVKLALVSVFFSAHIVAADHQRSTPTGINEKSVLRYYEKVTEYSGTATKEGLEKLAEGWIKEFNSPQEAFRYFFFDKEPRKIGIFLDALLLQVIKRASPQEIPRNSHPLARQSYVECVAIYQDYIIRYLIERPDLDPIEYFGQRLLINAKFLNSVTTHQNSSQLFAAIIRSIEAVKCNKALVEMMIRCMNSVIKPVDSLPVESERYRQIENNYFVTLFRLIIEKDSDKFYDILENADLEFRDYSIITQELHRILFSHFWQVLDNYLRIQQEIEETYFINKRITKASEEASRKLHLIEDHVRQIVRFVESASLFKECMAPLMGYAEQGKQLPPDVLELLASHPYTHEVLGYPEAGLLDEPHRKIERTKTYDFLKALDKVGMLRLMLAKPMEIPDGGIRYSGLLEVVLLQFVQELYSVPQTNLKAARDTLYEEFIPIIKKMLKRGADINVTTADGEQLWHIFLSHDHRLNSTYQLPRQWPQEIINHVAENYADIFALGPDGKTIFQTAYRGLTFSSKRGQSTKKVFMRNAYNQWKRSQKSSHEFFSPTIVKLELMQREFFIDFFCTYPEAISPEVVENLFFCPANLPLFHYGESVPKVIAGQGLRTNNNYFDIFLRNPRYFLKLAESFDSDYDWLMVLVGTLCKNPQFNINYQKENGDTFLHVLAHTIKRLDGVAISDELRSKRYQIIDTFIRLGADLDLLNHAGQKVFDICPSLDMNNNWRRSPNPKRRRMNNC